MGRRHRSKSQTLPSSPTYSSSSSEFEFRISVSPHKSSRPADELFYKGQILPLHLSPRLSMVQSLLLLSSSSSSYTTSRDSSASSDSSRPSSATDDDFIKRPSAADILSRKSPKYFSLAKFSSKTTSSVKRVSTTARGVLRKYLNKVKPLYEKLSHKQQQQQQQQQQKMPSPVAEARRSNDNSREISMSFSGNLRYPRRRSSFISSCPSSMTSSPRRGEVAQMGRVGSGSYNPGASSMAELQSAIQGAIAHCKNSMINNNAVSNE